MFKTRDSVIVMMQQIVYEGGFPTRVMVEDSSSYRPTKESDMQHVTEIFIRHDGWSLGASYISSKVAYESWVSEWVAHLRKQTWGWQVWYLPL